MKEIDYNGPMEGSIQAETMSAWAIPQNQSRRYAKRVHETFRALRTAIGTEEYDAAVDIFREASPEVRKSLRKPLDRMFRETRRLESGDLTDVRHTLDLYGLAARLTRIDPDLDWGQERIDYATDAERALAKKIGHDKLAKWYQEKREIRYGRCLDNVFTALREETPRGTEFSSTVRIRGQERKYSWLPEDVARAGLRGTDYIDIVVSHPQISGSVHIDLVNVAHELIEGLNEREAKELRRKYLTGEFYQIQIDGVSPRLARPKFTNGTSKVKHV